VLSRYAGTTAREVYGADPNRSVSCVCAGRRRRPRTIVGPARRPWPQPTGANSCGLMFQPCRVLFLGRGELDVLTCCAARSARAQVLGPVCFLAATSGADRFGT